MENNKKCKMCCLKQIKYTISLVQTESTVSKGTIDANIDSYLDAIIIYQKNLSDIKEITDRLLEILYSNFSNIQKDEYLEFKDSLNSIIKSLTYVYDSYTQNKLAMHLTNALEELHYSIADLKELEMDFQVSKVSIYENPRFKDLFNTINSF